MDLPFLSPDAKEVLRRAREVAEEHGRSHATLVDILMGLLDSQQALRLLEQFEAEPEKVRAAVLFMEGRVAWPAEPDAEERTIDLARSESGRLGQGETGPEHLVLALAHREGSLGLRDPRVDRCDPRLCS